MGMSIIQVNYGALNDGVQTIRATFNRLDDVQLQAPR
jgi:hypothetical protein